MLAEKIFRAFWKSKQPPGRSGETFSSRCDEVFVSNPCFKLLFLVQHMVFYMLNLNTSDFFGPKRSARWRNFLLSRQPGFGVVVVVSFTSLETNTGGFYGGTNFNTMFTTEWSMYINGWNVCLFEKTLQKMMFFLKTNSLRSTWLGSGIRDGAGEIYISEFFVPQNDIGSTTVTVAN